MEIRLNLYQADRDFQVEIGGGGFGYRLFGPKFDGSSRLIKSVILSERDKEEIVRFVNPDAEAVERENGELKEVLEDKHRLTKEIDIIVNGKDAAEQASLCDIAAQLRKLLPEKEAALTAAQGEVEWLRKLMNIRPVNCDPLRIIGG